MCRQSSEGSNKPEDPVDRVNAKSEPCLARKVEAIFRFILHGGQRRPRCGKLGDQTDSGIDRVGEVANSIRNREGSLLNATAIREAFHPGHDHPCETDVGRSLETFQATLFDQFIAEPGESKRILIIAEPMSCYVAEPNVDEARTVAATTLDAETAAPAGDEGEEIPIRKQCWRHHLGENIQSRDGGGVAHRGEVNDFLDFTAGELRPDPLILGFYLFLRWMERPVDCGVAQVVEADGNLRGPSDQASMRNIDTQARGHRQFDIIRGTQSKQF